MHKSRMPPALVVPFPEGIPVFTGRFGRHVAVPGQVRRTLYSDWDLIWVQSGKGAWDLPGGHVLRAHSGEFAILPPFTPAAIEGSKNLAFRHCHFDFRPLPERVPERLHSDCLGPGHRVHLPLTFTCRQAPGVWRAYRDLERLEPGRAGKFWRLESAVLKLVGALAEFASEFTHKGFSIKPFEPAAIRDERIRKLKAGIEAEPLKAWCVSELAESVGLSSGHLHRVCRAVLGKSPKRLIVETRLRYGLKLLKERPNGCAPSVKEVSRACGFSTQHFFSRQFKQYFRVSPRAYRDGTGMP